MGRVTLQTVADAVGVSRMTVSNAFSRPDQLSPQLRGTILAAAAELGYLGPDPAARALAKGSVGAVGVVLTESMKDAFLDPIAAAFFGAVADALAPTGLAVSLIPAQASSGHLAARDLPIDGALVVGCDQGVEAIDWLRRRHLPLVFVDNDPPPGYGRVGLDEHDGGRLAAQHLIDLGHTDIAVFTIGHHGSPPGWAADPHAELGNFVADARLAGARAALEDAGLAVRVLHVPDNRHEDADQGAALLLEKDSPTAVVCFSDLMAAAVLRAAQSRSLAVPEDLSVVGFDDSPVATAVRPALTTIRQDFLAKGRVAAHALVEAIHASRDQSGQSRADTTPHPHLVPVELVKRESTAPPPRP